MNATRNPIDAALPGASTETPSAHLLETQLNAGTEQGRGVVALAEELAAALAEDAPRHDREGSFPHEAIDLLKQAGYLSAPVPEHLGGRGVGSVHDLIVAQSRLARGNASVAIGVNMHFVVMNNMARLWRLAVASGDPKRPPIAAAALQSLVQRGTVVAIAGSEPGQVLTSPATTAVRTADGWTLNGKKIFATMSPAADLLVVSVTVEDGSGERRYAYAQVPANTEGVTIHEDWDAMGMRASGSHSITFQDARLPASAIGAGFAAGTVTQRWLEDNLTAGAFHAAAALGVAEAAMLEATGGPKRSSRRPDDPFSLMKAGQALVDLQAMRAILDRAGTVIDAYFDAALQARPDQHAALTAFAEVQAAKAFIGEAAVRVVDAAMALSGGAGFYNRSPLSRHYRDVRATAFMHPLGANRVFTFLGSSALDLAPELA